ncbi:MAG: hypothetical protein JST48_05165 [Bacteroidetes bacterium]|nr:hypothetical protein [Bacteroidota bacterium]
MKRLLFFFICELVCSWGGCQPTIRADSVRLPKLLDRIYNYRFDVDGDSLLNQIDPATQPLLEIFALRWKQIPVAYSPFSKHYLQLLLNNISHLETKKPSPRITYFKICTYLFLSEYHFSLNENWAALRYAQKAYPLVIETFDNNYTQPEFLFIKGLYLYYIEYYKQKSLFFRAALIPLKSGNKQEGLWYLRKSAEQLSLAQVEALIFAAHILLHLENKPYEALDVSIKLIEMYPQNLKFIELYTDNLLRCKLYTQAIPWVKKLVDQPAVYYSIPGHLFNGIIEEEYYQNKTEAKRAYQQCVVTKYKPAEHYQRLAYQRLKKIMAKSE